MPRRSFLTRFSRKTSGALLVTTALLVPATAQEQGAPVFDPLTSPTLSFYGLPGLMDTASAEMMPEGQLATSVSTFAGQSRYNVTFQPTPWATATFRYIGVRDLNLFGFEDYYDRSFDLRLRLWDEGTYRPAVAVGLQDFIGTGLYAGEYVVGTKTFETPALAAGRAPGQVKVSAGLGWGRLGSYGTIDTFGTRPSFDGGTGGQVAYDQWFRGDVAPFAGIEWQLDDRWGLKAEYSSDAYRLETQTSDVFERKSPLSFGVEYQARPGLRLGAYYLYGSQLGISAQMQLNPKRPVNPIRVKAPVPLTPRSLWATTPAQWSQDWAQSEAEQISLRETLTEKLAEDGLVLETLTLTGTSAELRYRSNRHRSYALTNGRAARAMARSLPASVEIFHIVPMEGGLPLSRMTLKRSDLEALEFAPDATEALQARAEYSGAPAVADSARSNETLYPNFTGGIGPYLSTSFFDPDVPLRADVGIEAKASYAFAPGWEVAGAVRHRLAGNVDGTRASNSVLPHVRTDQDKYAQYDTTLRNLYVTGRWKLAPDLYARATAGYLEKMYGGVSGEVLWKPVDSRLAFGLEANYVQQRDFNQRLGFQDYNIVTGHASAYYEAPQDFLLQLDVGRYLAGDVGATLSVDKTFANGWKVGAFASKTDVSAAEFGEGSFDKGLRFTIPLDWMLGRPHRGTQTAVVRPIQRDGAQRVDVPGRLYDDIRAAHQRSLTDQSARFWE